MNHRKDNFRECDPTWLRMPQHWGESALIGNGYIGASIYSDTNEARSPDGRPISNNALRWQIGRIDATAQGDTTGYLEPRVPIGDFLLEPGSLIVWEDFRMRLDLFQAEARGEMPTKEGCVQFRSIVHATRDLLIIDLDCDAGAAEQMIRFHPQEAISPWFYFKSETDAAKIPKPLSLELDESDEIALSIQKFPTGGQQVVAWKQVTLKEGTIRLFASVAVDRGDGSAVDTARQAVAAGCAADWELLLREHRDWWSQHYSRSRLRLPDTLINSFYQNQIYKMGAATRAEAPVLDILGPWMTHTPWPGVWWNLNVQFIYSPFYVSNHCDLAESLPRTLIKNIDNLKENVPEGFRGSALAIGRASTFDCKAFTEIGWEIGNLTYVCHNLWRHYRSTMDHGFLQDTLWPLLVGSVDFYLGLIEKGEDGKLHLPLSHSPEYGGHLALQSHDSNYDLALLKWACRTLIDLSQEFEFEDSKLSQWEEVIHSLTAFPVDERGLKVGADLSFATGHRHFCHLMAGYPLFVLDLEDSKDRELYEKSLKNWLDLEGVATGFTYTYAASAYAYLGKGDDALRCINLVIRHFIEPNTMYRERGPVLETPLHLADAIHDLVLQSARGWIDVFAAVPSTWKELEFENLRAEGGFLVSARLHQGKPVYLKIQSEASKICRVRCPFTNAVFKIQGEIVEPKPLSNGIFEIDLEQATLLEIFEESQMATSLPSEFPGQAHLSNYFGSDKPWRFYSMPSVESLEHS